MIAQLIDDSPSADVFAALLAGPVLLEIEPDHIVDLRQVLEFHDSPADGLLLIVLPAPALTYEAPRSPRSKRSGKPQQRSGKPQHEAPRELTGPHSLVIEGAARLRALKYARIFEQRTRQLLDLLQTVD